MNLVTFYTAVKKVTVRCCATHSLTVFTLLFIPNCFDSYQGVLYRLDAPNLLFRERGVKGSSWTFVVFAQVVRKCLVLVTLEAPYVFSSPVISAGEKQASVPLRVTLTVLSERRV